MQESNPNMPNQSIAAKWCMFALTTLVASASLLLASCAGTGLSNKTPEQQVEQRAQQRLAALMAWDLDKVMEYTTPTYRSRVSKNQYGSRYLGVANWTEARVDSVSCKEDRCDVKVQVTYEMVRPRITNTRPVDETWIQVDGKWYIYH